MSKEENGFQFSAAAFSTLQLELRKTKQNRKHFGENCFFFQFLATAFSTLQLYNVRLKGRPNRKRASNASQRRLERAFLTDRLSLRADWNHLR
jgi:hypothetical protein